MHTVSDQISLTRTITLLAPLDRLPDLRTRPKEKHGQRTPWRIFMVQCTRDLPTLDGALVGLDGESCSSNDPWLLNDSIIQTKNDLLDCKAQLLQQKTSKTRLLNVQVTEEAVNRSAQNQHHGVVRDKIHELFGV
jgi:hypothetical protein